MLSKPPPLRKKKERKKKKKIRFQWFFTLAFYNSLQRSLKIIDARFVYKSRLDGQVTSDRVSTSDARQPRGGRYFFILTKILDKPETADLVKIKK